MRDRRGIASALNNLGFITQYQEKYVEAQRFHAEAFAIRSDLGDRRGIMSSLNNLGFLALLQHDYDAAQPYLEQSLSAGRTLGDKANSVDCLEGLAQVYSAIGPVELAAQLWGTVEALRTALRLPLSPIEAAFHAQAVAIARDMIGADGWHRAWQTGATTSLDDAIELVLRGDRALQGQSLAPFGGQVREVRA